MDKKLASVPSAITVEQPGHAHKAQGVLLRLGSLAAQVQEMRRRLQQATLHPGHDYPSSWSVASCASCQALAQLATLHASVQAEIQKVSDLCGTLNSPLSPALSTAARDCREERR